MLKTVLLGLVHGNLKDSDLFQNYSFKSMSQMVNFPSDLALRTLSHATEATKSSIPSQRCQIPNILPSLENIFVVKCLSHVYLGNHMVIECNRG